MSALSSPEPTVTVEIPKDILSFSGGTNRTVRNARKAFKYEVCILELWVRHERRFGDHFSVVRLPAAENEAG